MAGGDFATEISRYVWQTRYRNTRPPAVDRDVEDTWRRVAAAVAAAEAAPERWATRFHEILRGFRFLPAGRILAGAGTGREVTLFNCFVMGIIEDSLRGIFAHLEEGALTMQQGGGVGYDFSTLRPRGSAARGAGTIASGPVSFMDVWDAMCNTILSTGARRGAMMATLRCDHPDIAEFVTAKARPGRLRHFNTSVLVTDEFMDAVDADADWPLVFPADALDETAETVLRSWSGRDGRVPCAVLGRMPARELWQLIMRSTYEHAEPGVLFVDRINAMNNLWYRERITATNPCGEVPLPPYGACDLGSVNLTRFVRGAFTDDAVFAFGDLRGVVQTAVRFLDDVVAVSRFPLPAHREAEEGCRRIGLGITGLADTLIMLGLRYGSAESLRFAEEVMRVVRDAAYEASIALAREKGPFPYFDRERYLEGAFVRTLPAPIRGAIAVHGIRNSHLLAIAPTGTISLLAGAVSSSLEPVFAFRYERAVLDEEGVERTFLVEDEAWRAWRQTGRGARPRRRSSPPPSSVPRSTWRCRPVSSRSSTTPSRRRSTCPRSTRSSGSCASTGAPTSSG
jgi:ribonucleoside-diphosphate reductase, adenosylcobalamin-dependent